MALRYAADGVVEQPLGGERETEVGVGHREVRVELDGFAELGDGVVELPLALECEPEAVVGGREEGVPVDPLHLPRKY